MAKYQRPRAGASGPVVEPEPALPRPTPAMLEQAAASDLREAFPFFHDEEAVRWERDTLFGHAELALAQD